MVWVAEVGGEIWVVRALELIIVVEMVSWLKWLGWLEWLR